jgi:hypothetical protein
MTTLHIEHAIRDFDTWKKAFESDPAGRERSGVRCYQVSRPIDDPFGEGLAAARMALDQAQQALGRADETSEEVKALKATYDARLSALEARLLPRTQISEWVR